MSYFSRLMWIFSLLSSTENPASKEVFCGQTERSGQGWLLQPLPSLQPSRVTSGTGPIYRHPRARRAGRGKLQQEFLHGLFLHTYDIQKAERLLDIIWVDHHHLCCSHELDHTFIFL